MDRHRRDLARKAGVGGDHPPQEVRHRDIAGARAVERGGESAEDHESLGVGVERGRPGRGVELGVALRLGPWTPEEVRVLLVRDLPGFDGERIKVWMGTPEHTVTAESSDDSADEGGPFIDAGGPSV